LSNFIRPQSINRGALGQIRFWSNQPESKIDPNPNFCHTPETVSDHTTAEQRTAGTEIRDLAGRPSLINSNPISPQTKTTNQSFHVPPSSREPKTNDAHA
jgi:hypothetical protein